MRTDSQNKKKTRSSFAARFAAFSRALAFFIGVFSLLNILGQLRYPGFDANHWWIDFRPIVPIVARALLAVTAALLVAYSIKPFMSQRRHGTTLVFVAVLLMFAIFNAVGFYILLIRGTITSACPVAFSVFVASSLVVVLAAMLIPRLNNGESGFSRTTFAATIMFCLIAFPIAQMFCFGKTDYRRNADAIVVFGARAYADGRCSDALADRVRTGSRLYLDGFADRLVMSGGPGDGDIHETEAMKRLAVELGVPGDSVILDTKGLNTYATVNNTCLLFDQMNIERVLTVSHSYHLPRIKMTYQRSGLDVYTVPARETYPLTALPIYMLREVAALWVYYLRPLVP